MPRRHLAFLLFALASSSLWLFSLAPDALAISCECIRGSDQPPLISSDLANCCRMCGMVAPQTVGLNSVTTLCPAAPAPSGPATSTAISTGGSSVSLTNPLGNVTVPQLIGRVIRAMIGLAGSVALLMFVYGGIRWITAGGSDENVTKAKTILKHATIGLLMIFLSYTIVAAFFGALATP